MGGTGGPSTTLRTFRRQSRGWRGHSPSAALRAFRRPVEVVGMVLWRWRPGACAGLFLHKNPQEDVMKKIRRHNNPVGTKSGVISANSRI